MSGDKSRIKLQEKPAFGGQGESDGKDLGAAAGRQQQGCLPQEGGIAEVNNRQCLKAEPEFLFYQMSTNISAVAFGKRNFTEVIELDTGSWSGLEMSDEWANVKWKQK